MALKIPLNSAIAVCALSICVNSFAQKDQPALSKSEKAEIEANTAECMNKPHYLKSSESYFCMKDGAFKKCDEDGTLKDPPEGTPDPNSAHILLTLVQKCIYCRSGGNVEFNLSQCQRQMSDLVALEGVQTQQDEQKTKENIEFYTKDIPQFISEMVTLTLEGYQLYETIRQAVQDPEEPPPPPPGEEAIGPDFQMPSRLSGLPPSGGPGGQTQAASPSGTGRKKGGKFLGMGKDDKPRQPSEVSPPSGAGAGAGGSGGGGGGSGAGAVGASPLDASGPSPQFYDTSDKTVAFSGSGSASGTSTENELLKDLLSEDNETEGRFKKEGKKTNGAPSVPIKRTGIVLLIERIHYTTEKVVGEVYIPPLKENEQ